MPDKLVSRIPCAMKIEWLSGAPAGAAEAHQWYFDRVRRPGMVAVEANIPAELDGIPALQTMFEIPDPQGADSVRGAIITLPLYHEVVAFLLLAPEAEWPAAGKIFLALLDSVKLLGVIPFLTNPQAAPPRAAVQTARAAEIRDGNFAFQVPPGWQVNRKGPAADGYQLVELIPESGAGAIIQVRHRNFAAGGPPGGCDMARHQFEGSLSLDIGGMFLNDVPVAESVPAGGVTTRLGTRNFKHPELALMTSAVCSVSDIALLGYIVNQGVTDQKPARDRVLQSISFGGARPSLSGTWQGQGSVLTLSGDGTAEISFSNGLANQGSYVTQGSRLTFEWRTLMSLPRRATWNCDYSLQGLELRLNCDAGGARTYRRGP